MDKKDLQNLAKIIQKVIQVEVKKLKNDLLTEIKASQKVNKPLREHNIITPKPTESVNQTYSLNSIEFLKEMVKGGPTIPDIYDEMDMPPVNKSYDELDSFMNTDYSQTLKKIEESGNRMRGNY